MRNKNNAFNEADIYSSGTTKLFEKKNERFSYTIDSDIYFILLLTYLP